MPAVNLNRAEFDRSAASPAQFLHNSLPKFAFAGRSNVGKSSVINRLLNRRQFARVGATPGKTVHVNYYRIDDRIYFVDLPGYGFAKVSEVERIRWAKLMESFFGDSMAYDVGILIVDARHKPTGEDCQMAEYFRGSDKPFLVVANKLDKLKKSEISGNLLQIRETLKLGEEITLVPFSAEKGDGRDLLIRELTQYL